MEQIGDESPDESGFIGVSKLVCGESDQKHGDVRDGGVVTHTGEATNARFLNGHGEQTAEDAFNGCTPVVVFFENISAVGDGVADALRQAPEVVASFLFGVLGVVSRAQKHSRMLTIVERT